MLEKKNIIKHNRDAWDNESVLGNPATQPLSNSDWESAKERGYQISLTGNRFIPKKWLGELSGTKTLCLACGGGQQVPLLAAAGADVTSHENSPRQLQADLEIAKAHNLKIQGKLGDMSDLSSYSYSSFDLVVIGMGVQFVPEIDVLWSQIANICRPKARFVAAFMNPHNYIFDWEIYERGELKITHSIPYSDLTSISYEDRKRLFGELEPIEFGHSHEQIIGGITTSGFIIDGYLEDYAENELSAKFMPSYFVLTGHL